MSGVIWGWEIIQISNQLIQRSGNPESKHVGGNLGFEDYPNLKLDDPTVWNPESKHVGGNLGFGDYLNLKLGDPMVWNPKSKHVGGNFGLETVQISN